MSARVLILFAHPSLQKSRVNRRLGNAVRRLPGVTFHDLYDRYPDFAIDVKAEQEMLAAHDVIILQHPLYWYSVPAIVREWQDLVLEYGFAYGESGTALRGKVTGAVISTGGSAEAYAPGHGDRFTVRQFLAPFEQTARLCGMTFLAPCVFHGPDVESEDGLADCAARYVQFVEALRDGTLDIAAAQGGENLAGRLGSLIAKGAAA
jgi:glutathione-regulated potassium-efflux system ancillary protein KefG